jgi:hypothetical protein
VTALFTEYTGVHESLTLEWTLKPAVLNPRLTTNGTHVESPLGADAAEVAGDEPGADTTLQFPRLAIHPADDAGHHQAPAFATVADLAKALNRLDPVALEVAAREPSPDILVDGPTVKKLLGTFWFRSIFSRLSASWRESLFASLAESLVIPNHALAEGRQVTHLADGSYAELRDIAARMPVTGAAAIDLQLLLTIMQLWGQEARRRLQFVEVPAPAPSRLSSMLGLLK